VSNYDVQAVLALPHMPERQLRVLIALATVTPEADGWRKIGGKLLAEKANLHPDTVKTARHELVEAGLLDYEPGNGRRHFSRYRLTVTGTEDFKGGADSSPPSAEKGGVNSSPPSAEKGGADSSPPSGVKGGSDTRERGGRTAEKGGGGQLADLRRRDHCSKDFDLKTSDLEERAFAPGPQTSPRTTTRGTELLAEHVAACRPKPPRDVIQLTGKKIDALIADETAITDGQIRAGLERMRAKNLGPRLLPELVYEAMNASGPDRNGHRPVGRRVNFADEDYASGF
jgi:hypothetical protein